MKICPTCKKIYTDETLNFCLEDGTVLTPLQGSGSAASNQATVFIPTTPPPPEKTVLLSPPPTAEKTVLLSPPKPTAEKTVMLGSTSDQPVGNQTVPSNWETALPEVFPEKPRKKSRKLMWIVGLVGALILVGVFGVVGLLALLAMGDDEEPTVTFANAKYKTVLTDDFSGWQTGSDDYGKKDFRNGEFILSSKQSGTYYVLVTFKREYKTTNASTKVTVRNVNGATTPLGYGLLVHSSPTEALVSDYAFLIDAATQSYRIVTHIAKKENEVVKWTRVSFIRPGTQANELEVKDVNGSMTFYINGNLVTTLQDTTNYRDGVTGIYASDGIPVAFSKLYQGKQ